MKLNDIKKKTIEVTSENYENIFNIYTDENGFYYFDLLKKIDFPSELDPDVYDYYMVKGDETYPNIAYKAYNNVTLWWIICAINNIDNPVAQPSSGTILKMLKPDFVKLVLGKLNTNE
jgi:hypothetical protein